MVINDSFLNCKAVLSKKNKGLPPTLNNSEIPVLWLG